MIITVSLQENEWKSLLKWWKQVCLWRHGIISSDCLRRLTCLSHCIHIHTHTCLFCVLLTHTPNQPSTLCRQNQTVLHAFTQSDNFPEDGMSQIPAFQTAAFRFMTDHISHTDDAARHILPAAKSVLSKYSNWQWLCLYDYLSPFIFSYNCIF